MYLLQQREKEYADEGCHWECIGMGATGDGQVGVEGQLAHCRLGTGKGLVLDGGSWP